MTPDTYAIDFTRQARKDLGRLDVGVAKRVAAAIDALANDPRPAGCLKIVSEEGVWRIRVSEYRIAYAIDDAAHVVTIARIGHRSSFYS